MKILKQFSNQENKVYVIDMGSWVVVELPPTYDVKKIDLFLKVIAYAIEKPVSTFFNDELITMDIHRTRGIYRDLHK